MNIEWQSLIGHVKKLLYLALIPLCSPRLFALESPAIAISTAEYSAFCNSINLKVVTNRDEQLVEFVLLLNKPAERNLYWNLNLNLYEGTNLIARSKLGCHVFAPNLSRYLHDKQFANKVVQQFSFSVDPYLITNSFVVFTQGYEMEKTAKFPGSAITPRVVQLYDMYSSFKSDTNNFTNVEVK